MRLKRLGREFMLAWKSVSNKSSLIRPKPPQISENEGKMVSPKF